MTVGFDTIYKKTVSLNFTVKNTSSLQKTINVFGSKIKYNDTLDLLTIPRVSEADIRHSLIKGELYKKIKTNDIRIVSGSIDLSQFDSEQRQFLLDAGLTDGFTSVVSPILWASDGSGDVSTWEEVMIYVNKSVSPIIININSSETIPAGIYDMKQARIEYLKLGDPNNVTLNLEDGVILKDLAGCSGAFLFKVNSTTVPPLQFTPRNNIIVFLNRLSTDFINLGTVPMIEVADGQVFAFVGIEAVRVDPSSISPIISLGSGSTGIFTIFSTAGYPNDIVVGPADAVLGFQHDGTIQSPIPTFSGFLGTIVNGPLGGGFGGSGPSYLRPMSIFGVLPRGMFYFDTDLIPPRPIFWDGNVWVDSSGTPV